MSLYLVIFDGDTQVEGWAFGQYSDFGVFRDTIARHLAASDYPILMEHSDCDGEWSVAHLAPLRRELLAIENAFRKLPPEEFQRGFEHTKQFRTGAASLYDCFHNVDGENIIEALGALCDKAMDLGKPILFQ